MTATALGLFFSGALFGAGMLAWVAMMGYLLYRHDQDQQDAGQEGQKP